jgi:hypothetical protein
MNYVLVACSIWAALICGFVFAMIRTESTPVLFSRRPASETTLGKDSVNWLAALAVGGALVTVLLAS